LPFEQAMNQSAPVVGVISQMITPAIFIFGAAALVNGALTRIVRVVDNTRALLARMREARTGDPAYYQALVGELAVYRRRAAYVEVAIAAYYASVGLFVAASLAVAIDVFSGGRLPWAATILTILGALMLLVGSVALLLEIRLATGALRREIERESYAATSARL
jgi:hypothetical protein